MDRNNPIADTASSVRIVVVTSETHGLPVRSIRALSKLETVRIDRVIFARESLYAENGRRLLRKIRKALRIGLLASANGVRIRKWFEDPDKQTVAALCEELGIELCVFERVNGEDALACARNSRAHIGLAAGTVFIGRKFAGAFASGMLNVHLNKLPEYRNGRSVLWSLYNGDDSTGVFIHRLTPVIDGGSILHGVEIPIVFESCLKDTVTTTMARIFETIEPALHAVFRNFESSCRNAREQTGGSSFTTPTIRQWIQICRNHARMARAKRS